MEETPLYILLLLIDQARQINGHLSPEKEKEIDEYFLMTDKDKILHQLNAKAYVLFLKIKAGSKLTTRQQIEVELLEAGVYKPGMVNDHYMDHLYEIENYTSLTQMGRNFKHEARSSAESFEIFKKKYPGIDYEKDV